MSYASIAKVCHFVHEVRNEWYGRVIEIRVRNFLDYYVRLLLIKMLTKAHNTALTRVKVSIAILSKVLFHEYKWQNKACRIHKLLLQLGPNGTTPNGEVIAYLQVEGSTGKGKPGSGGMAGLLKFLQDRAI